MNTDLKLSLDVIFIFPNFEDNGKVLDKQSFLNHYDVKDVKNIRLVMLETNLAVALTERDLCLASVRYCTMVIQLIQLSTAVNT